MSNQRAFRNSSEVETRDVLWLWPLLIPYGMVTIIEGDPGIGKSYLAMYIAAMVSVGGQLPGGQRVKRQIALIMSAEDDASYTIRPRIEAMGGDPKRIRFQARYSPFNDEGLERLRREVSLHRPGCIIIDPLYAYVPSPSDMYKPNEIRELLAKIAEIASETGAAVIVIRHLTKAKSDKAIYQGVGSIDVIGAARSALLVAKHPENDQLKVIAHIKHNLSPKGHSWVYELVPSDEGLPILEWRGKSDLTPEDLLDSRQGGPSAVEDATGLLKDCLKNGPKPAKTIITTAAKEGISERTLNRAKKVLQISAYKEAQAWMWRLLK